MLSKVQSPGIPLMGDAFGGVIAGVLYDVNQGDDFRAYVRLGNAGGVAPWRYESAGSLLRPAIGPDGSLFAIEFMYGGLDSEGDPIWDKHAIVIDGLTGRLVSRLPLSREILAFESAMNGQVLSPTITCRSTRIEKAPQTVGPIVGSDGRGYLLVRRRVRLAHDSCYVPNEVYKIARTEDIGIDLVAVSPSSASTVESVYARQCASGGYQQSHCDYPPDATQLLPDGLDGMLATWQRATTIEDSVVLPGQKYVSRIDALGAKLDNPVAADFGIDLIGEGGTAYVHSATGRSAIDLTSFTTKWPFPVSGALPVAALMDEGVALYDTETGIMSEVVDGTVSGTVTLSLEQPNQSKFGMRTGIDRTGPTPRLASVIGLPLNEASTSFGFLGNALGQSAPRQWQFAKREDAALAALDYIYPYSAIGGWEHGGLICESGGLFAWSKIVTDMNRSRVTVPESLCPPTKLAARYHTHPGLESSQPSNPDDYDHADANPGAPSYLKTRRLGVQETRWPPFPTQFLSLWRSPSNLTRIAIQNVCVRTGSTWSAYQAGVPTSAGAICAPPVP